MLAAQKLKTEEISTLVKRGAEEMGLELPSFAGAAFEEYYRLLEQYGRHTNLTAIKGVEDVARLHFLDSIALLKTSAFKGARVIDIGSGAGFPGVPIRIAEPTVKLTLLDAAGKRVEFLSTLCTAISIDAQCVCARAEVAAHDTGFREKYDIALSRAVAQLDILCELCLPFVRTGGLLIAMKGVNSTQELAEASGASTALGAGTTECLDYALPGTDITHRAIIIRKTSATPAKYPRRFARILKSPL